MEVKNTVPKDKGWAWVILLGSLVNILLMNGMLKSGGILFVAYQTRFKSSSAMTSLLSTVQLAIFSVAAWLVMLCGTKLLSERTLIMTGACLNCVSFVITSQAETIGVLVLSYGIIHGIAGAFIIPTCLSIVNKYFDKRRGLANCITNCGSSLGNFCFPPLLTFLFYQYGFSGCVLLIGGILLNGCVFGALLRPTTFYKARTSFSLEKEQALLFDFDPKNHNKEKDKTVYLDECIDKDVQGDIKKESTVEQRLTVQCNGDDFGDKYKCKLNLVRSTEELNIHVCTSSIKSSSYSVHHGVEKSIERFDSQNEDKESIQDISRDLKYVCDISIFKMPMFYIYLLVCLFSAGPALLSSLYIPPLAKDNGLSPKIGAILATVIGVVDLFSKLGVGVLSDTKWLKSTTISAIASIVLGVSANLVRFYTSYTTLVIYAVICGLCNGVHFSLFPVVFTDFLGTQKIESGIGFGELFHGISCASLFYIVGYLRDISGSYVLSYHVLGSCGLVSALLLLSMTLMHGKVAANHHQETEVVVEG